MMESGASNAVTGAEAGLGANEQILIALRIAAANGGTAQMKEINEAACREVEARLPNSTLSEQGSATLRHYVNTTAVQAGYFLPYDARNPGWRITPKGREFLSSTISESAARLAGDVAASEAAASRACWFVGAAYGGRDDQMPRFLEEGIWENGYEDRHLDLVRSMQPGDRIAIKAAYTRKRDLPFNNRGHAVSVMAIKAIGTVTANTGDGRKIQVEWTPLDEPQEWYFFTNRTTIWRVLPGEWMSDALIAFAFEGKPQDIKRFCNEPYWRERFGDVDDQRFQWSGFYQALADRLLDYQNDRTALLEAIYGIAKHVEGLSYLKDQYTDGTSGPLKDICPFTVFGIFNRGISDVRRRVIAAELAKALGIEVAIPEAFGGIPTLDARKSWYFSYEKDRQQDDIESLWNVFASAVYYADSGDPDARSVLAAAYDNAHGRPNVGWNLSMGLYWVRPWSFVSLDGRSRHYISSKLAEEIPINGPRERCNAKDYLSVIDRLETRFKEESYPVHSFPQLSLAAWLYKDFVEPATIGNEDGEEQGAEDEDGVNVTPPIQPYSIDDIITDGCFVERAKLESMLHRLRVKKNLILQGPPGTGKTWLAKRLGFALMGERNDSRLRAVQFHPNLSYEDFVRGWRPTAEGKLSLVDGPFIESVSAALRDPSASHVVVIEEINRGNPAQIFGEMLTLLEASKRNPDAALELCYRTRDGERKFIPENLYVVGTMNIADRSLALVDLALRRRFAFVDLEPVFGDLWREWVCANHPSIGKDILIDIEKRIVALNDSISGAAGLGVQFRIGHSFVTPDVGTEIPDAREWFRQVVETEIGPTLDEYWFDAPERSRAARQKLTEGF